MNGISVKYVELLNLHIEQPFYSNNICKKYTLEPIPDFEIVPSIECEQTLKKLDGIFKRKNEKSGFTVLSRVQGKNDDNEDRMRFKPKKEDKLSFWLVLKNPSVVNYNQLPVVFDSSKIFYFSNQLTDAEASRNSLHLSTDSTGVDENKDMLKKETASYQYHHNAVVAEHTAVVKHHISGIEVSPNAIINQTGSADLYFDLSLLPQGQCTLFINHIEQDSFYFMGIDAPKQAFGVIELLLDTTLEANYRIIETDYCLSKERPLFNLRFLNRTTLWRYTLLLQTNSPLYLEMNALPANSKQDFKNKLNITTNDNAIKFKQTSASPDGTSFQFESTSALPLQEKYISSSSVTKDALNLTLKKYVGVPMKEETISNHLPCPSDGFIDAKNNPVIYSDILITI